MKINTPRSASELHRVFVKENIHLELMKIKVEYEDGYSNTLDRLATSAPCSLQIE